MPQTSARTPTTESTAIIQKSIACTPSTLSLVVECSEVVTHGGCPRNRVVVSSAGAGGSHGAHLYARVLAAVLVVFAAAAAAGIPKEGLGVSVLYVGLAAVFAYAGFRRGEAAIVRSVVAAMGSLLLVTGVLLALAMGVVGFPFEGRYWLVGLAHAALGGVTMACAVLLPCDDE